MCPLSLGAEVGASKSTVANDSELSAAKFTAENGRDDELWFKNGAHDLLPNDAGFALSILTGVSQSTCYRAARGDTQPSLYLYRRLLHGDGGKPWLDLLMDGCTAAWWRQHKSIAAKAALLDRLRAEIERQLTII